MDNEIEQDEHTIINELLLEKDHLASEGKYLEANEIKNKIATLKQMSSSQKTITLSDYQNTESQRLEAEFNSEYKTLIDYWDDKLRQYEDNAKRNEEEMIKMHNEAMEALINDLTTKYKPMKYSKEYIEAKTIETSLAKQEKFKEAHYYKVKCDKLEQIETDRYIKIRNESIQIKGEALGYKQANERKVFKQRYETNLDLLMKQKEKDIEKLNMKYRNKKNDLDDIHKKQLKQTQNENKLRVRATNERIASSFIKTMSKSNNDTGDLRYSYNNAPYQNSHQKMKTVSKASEKDQNEKVVYSNIDFDAEAETNMKNKEDMEQQPMKDVNDEMMTNQNGHIEEDEEQEENEHNYEEEDENNGSGDEIDDNRLQDLNSNKIKNPNE